MGTRFVMWLALASAISLTSSVNQGYGKHHVISVNIENEQQRTIVNRLDAPKDGVQFLRIAAGNQTVTLIIAPNNLTDVESLLSNNSLTYRVETSNSQENSDNKQAERNIPVKLEWTDYYPLNDIYAWLDEKIEQYPELLTNYVVGTTYENRTIRAVKLSSKRVNNPTVFIESNVHAREWITAATTTYFLNELLTSKNESIVDLAQNIDWVIIPVLNPDGYEFTHTHNRLWRKNRRINDGAPDCLGVDLNRNFDAGLSDVTDDDSWTPCGKTYTGPSAFSEHETLALAQFIAKFENIKLYLAFHAYGQHLMFPYGYKDEVSPSHEHLNRIGLKCAEAISRRYGTDYSVGSFISNLYPASGTSVDWTFEKRNITLSYTLEFRPHRRTPKPDGFILPADEIIPNSEEVIDGIVAIIAEARALNYFSSERAP